MYFQWFSVLLRGVSGPALRTLSTLSARIVQTLRVEELSTDIGYEGIR